MGLRQTVAPLVEPLSLAEAKLFLRLDDDLTDDDGLVVALTVAAREAAERLTDRALITQTWELTLDSFFEEPYGFWDGRRGWLVQLPKARLQAVTSLKYLDTGGTERTLAADQYLVDAKGEPGRLYAAYGKIWPVARNQANAVTITFTAGYGDAAADVPEGVKLAMRLMLSSWYWPGAAATPDKFEVPAAAERLLLGYWVGVAS